MIFSAKDVVGAIFLVRQQMEITRFPIKSLIFKDLEKAFNCVPRVVIS